MNKKVTTGITTDTNKRNPQNNSMTKEHQDPYDPDSSDAKKINNNEALSSNYMVKAAENMINESSSSNYIPKAEENDMNESSSESMEISDDNSFDEIEDKDPENKKA